MREAMTRAMAVESDSDDDGFVEPEEQNSEDFSAPWEGFE